MNPASLVRLLLLAAIWGGAFAFTRVAAPVLGAFPLVAWRVGIGAAFLALVAVVARRGLPLGAWRILVVMGVLNMAVPHVLLAFAAIEVGASVLSLVNATAPVFSALIGAAWMGTPITARIGLGLLLGVTGVGIVVFGTLPAERPPLGAIAAGLAAAFFYGVASNYNRRVSGRVSQFDAAHGSLWAATLLVLPGAIVSASVTGATPVPADLGVAAAVLGLGVLCTGVAYLLYFRLIADVGPTGALTVTFLIPAFGVAWGVGLLGEPLTPALVVGGLVVLCGTVLATGPGAARNPVPESRAN